MKFASLSLKKAQQLLITSQKLTASTMDPLAIIEHLGYVQIDTISVVERAHHHTFWSRNADYQPKDLDDLVHNKKVFEYWSHAASFLPMKDYRYTLPMKKKFQQRERSSYYLIEPKVMKYVMRTIASEGPMKSKDFENSQPQKNSGWWDWKSTKKALEILFREGHLVISHREGFQKVYDLPERVIPKTIDTSFPSQEEYYRFLILRTLRHHGLASFSEISYMQKTPIKNEIKKLLNEMLLAEKIVSVSVENLSETYFSLPNNLKKIPRFTSKTLILSPFDNFVIQRKKLKTFFNFDYQIECYVPEPKRKYGYFSLPIFYGTQPVARIDCKADRKNKKLIVKSIHYEKNVDRQKIKHKIDKKLKSYAKFNSCSSILY